MRRTRVKVRAGSVRRVRGGLLLAGLLALGACGGTTVIEAGAPVPVSDSTPGPAGGGSPAVTDGELPVPGTGGGTSGGPGRGIAVGEPDPADPEAPVSSVPGKGATDEAPEPEVVEPRPGMADVHAVTWERAEVLGPKEVRIHFWGGVEPCYVLDSVKVRYRAKTVVVTLYSGSDPAKPDVACIEIAKAMAVDVPLTEALAGRKLVDGAPAS